MFSRRQLVTALTAGAAVAIAHEDHDSNPALDRVGLIHGATGPFAVAGYRMGEAALRELKLKRGSFDLEVIHYAPREVQWSCIVDGLQAATGTSLGKLNLSLADAPKDKVVSVIRNRKTGQEVRYALTPEFVKEYLNLPMAKLAAAGARLTAMKEAQIFAAVR
jgi:formylmethanofuran dehydrogenase subunit E